MGEQFLLDTDMDSIYRPIGIPMACHGMVTRLVTRLRVTGQVTLADLGFDP